MQTLRQPDASRGRAANFWYEVRMRDSNKENLRRILMKEQHPMEKLKRIGWGPLSVEGIPRGRYRLLAANEVEELRKAKDGKAAVKAGHAKSGGVRNYKAKSGSAGNGSRENRTRNS